MKDNPFIIADQISKARTAAAQATTISVIANRKLSEYVPRRADYTWKPEASSEGGCNDPTCRATHKGYRPYRHSVGCIAYKEAYGKRPSELIEHTSPNPDTFIHDFPCPCPNTLEQTSNSNDQRSEESYEAQHIKEHLAAAAKWHAGNQDHAPHHDQSPSLHALQEHMALEVAETQAHSPSHRSEMPNETRQHRNSVAEDGGSPTELQRASVQGVSYKTGEIIPPLGLAPQSKVISRHTSLGGSKLIRVRSPTSWLKKQEKNTGDRSKSGILKKPGTSLVHRRVSPGEDGLDFSTLRSRLRHHDAKQSATKTKYYPANSLKMPTTIAHQEPDNISMDQNPDQLLPKSPSSHMRPSEKSPGPERFIVAPEPQSYRIYYDLSASLESSPRATDSEELPGSKQSALSSSESSRRGSLRQIEHPGNIIHDGDIRDGGSFTGRRNIDPASMSSHRLHLSIRVPIGDRPLTS